MFQYSVLREGERERGGVRGKGRVGGQVQGEERKDERERSVWANTLTDWVWGM